MKTLYHFKNLLAAGVVIILTAATCGPEINPVEPPQPAWETVELSLLDGTKSRTYDFMEYERVFDVEMTRNFYTILSVEIPKACESWISYSANGGSRIRFHLLENPGSEMRVADLKITAGNSDNVVTVRINQIGAQMKGSMRYGLNALYNATNSLGWTRHDNWGTDKPISEWEGITLVSSASVDGKRVYSGDIDIWDIKLYGIHMKGVIPDAFWDVCKVFREINFGGNMSLDVPLGREELGTPDQMYLSGSEIPDSFWHENLTKVNFSLTGIKVNLNASVANAVNLQELELDYSNIGTSIPDAITTLKNLKKLGLTGCNLKGTLPKNIGDLQNLELLGLSKNSDLTGEIPDSFYNLGKLRLFNLGWTGISGTLSTKVANLQNLENLNIGGNHMSGKVPEELGLLKKLINVGGDITIQYCHFTNLPEALRFLHPFDGAWPSWGVEYNRYQYKDGIFLNFNNAYINPSENSDLMTLPMPKWYKERYGIWYWSMSGTYRTQENNDNPIYNPVYPVANDLQYPANEYYFDEKISAWTHPKYNGKAAKHYHIVNGTWTYDESFDWNAPADNWDHPAEETKATAAANVVRKAPTASRR